LTKDHRLYDAQSQDILEFYWMEKSGTTQESGFIERKGNASVAEVKAYIAERMKRDDQ
jgi:hypothetical protein